MSFKSYKSFKNEVDRILARNKTYKPRLFQGFDEAFNAQEKRIKRSIENGRKTTDTK